MSDDVREPESKPKNRSTNPKGRSPIKLTPEQIIAALRANCGMISRAARKLKVSNETLRHRIRNSERLQLARDEIRADVIDLAEDNMIAILQDPKHRDHGRFSEFVLRTLGRARGFGDKVEVGFDHSEKRVMLVLPQKAPLPGDEPEASEPEG